MNKKKLILILLPVFAAATAAHAFFLSSTFWISLIWAAAALAVAFFFAGESSKPVQAPSNSQWEGIIAALQDGIIVYDREFVISYFNSQAEKIFNLKAPDVIGHPVSPQDAQNPNTRILAQTVYPTLAPVMIPQSDPEAEVQAMDLSFSDPELELSVSTSPLKSENGQVFSFVKVVRDRTSEIAVLKSKNEFITVASHQLRTPLTEITWALENLAASRDLSGADKLIVSDTLKAAKGIISVTEDILSIAKMEEGRFGYSFTETDVISFLSGVLEQVYPLIKQTGLRLYFDRPPAALPKVKIDQKSLSIALSNFIENAIRYNVKGGEVTVKVEALPNQPFVKISVKDTGIGIPREALQKLFTKFYRAENAVKSQTRGSGLGLYIVKNIVRAHGGTVGADSEINRGSVFWLTLPSNPALVPSRETPFRF